MVELVRYIVGELVSKDAKFDVELKTVENEYDEIIITVPAEDIGKVIGKQGKIAKAIRTIVRSASMKEGKKYNVIINEQ